MALFCSKYDPHFWGFFHKSRKSKAKELFEMAYDIQSDVFDMMDELEVIQDMLNRLTELYPKSLMD